MGLYDDVTLVKNVHILCFHFCEVKNTRIDYYIIIASKTVLQYTVCQCNCTVVTSILLRYKATYSNMSSIVKMGMETDLSTLFCNPEPYKYNL